jgi:hypothetical protein
MHTANENLHRFVNSKCKQAYKHRILLQYENTDKKENSYHTIACWVMKKLDLVIYIKQKKAQLFRAT